MYWIACAFFIRPNLLDFLRKSAPRGDLFRFSRHLIPDAIIVAIALGALFALRFAYYGELLPNTYFAKADGHWGQGAWEYVRQNAFAPFLGPVGVLIATAGLFVRRSTPASSLRPLVATALGGIALVFITGADWMIGGRFVVPYLPLLALVVGFGWLNLTGRIFPRTRWLPAFLLVLAIPASSLLLTNDRRTTLEYVNTRARGYVNAHAALATWLCSKGRAAPGETVALMDIGIIGLRCPEQRILDTTGLTDRFIARSPGPFLKKDYDPKYVFDRRPAYVVLVLGAPKTEARSTPPDRLFFWSPIGRKIGNHPDFARFYRRPAAHAGPTWAERFAARIGALRVFVHDHPTVHYVLAVFQRQGAAR